MSAETTIGLPAATRVGNPGPAHKGTADPTWARVLLIGLALGFMGLMLVLPLVSVFVEALNLRVSAKKKAKPVHLHETFTGSAQ